MNNTRQRPTLPAHCPSLLKLAVYRRTHKGLPQWQGRYRFYHNGVDSDYMTVVVNPTRFARPQDGEEWWVEPIAMAPHARVLFATARYKAEDEPQQPEPKPQAKPAVRAPRYGDSLDYLGFLLQEFRL